jgi:Tfp pilus assembly protein PilP
MTPQTAPESHAAQLATQTAKLANLALIGVIHKHPEPMALIRTTFGGVQPVRVGDLIAGRDVVAIGEDRVILTRSGSQTVLEMPRE